MAYANENNLIGQLKVGNLTNVQPFQLGTFTYQVDPVYGGGEFILLPTVAGQTIGSVVQYDAYNATTALWAGTANSGRPLAIAMASDPAGGNYAWFQVSGQAVVNTSGTVTAGSAAYWQANGVVSSTAVGGKQALAMVALTANGVPAANQAVYSISRVHAEGAIT